MAYFLTTLYSNYIMTYMSFYRVWLMFTVSQLYSWG